MGPKSRGTHLLIVSVIAAALLAVPRPASAGSDALKMAMKKFEALAKAGDTRRMTAMFNFLAAFSPEEYPNWEGIALKGKAASQRGDIVGAKAACQSCHDQYRDAYRAKHGSGSGGPQPVDD